MSTAVLRPLHQRVVDTFWSPEALFTEMRERPRWGAALLVGISTAALIPFAIPDEIVASGVRDAGGMDTRAVANLARFFMMVGIAVVRPLQLFLFAGALMLVFTVLLRGTARYPQYLAVGAHTLLISALGLLVALPVQISTASMDVEFTLALLTPFVESGSLAYTLLDRIDVFMLWVLVATGVGTSVVNPGQRWHINAAILIGLYLALHLIRIAVMR